MATKYETALLALILSNPEPGNVYLYPTLNRVIKLRNATFELISIDDPDWDGSYENVNVRYLAKHNGISMAIHAVLNVWQYPNSDGTVEADIGIELDYIKIGSKKYNPKSNGRYIHEEISSYIDCIDHLDKADIQEMFEMFEKEVFDLYNKIKFQEHQAAEREIEYLKIMQRRYKAWLKHFNLEDTEKTRNILQIVSDYEHDGTVDDQRELFCRLIDLIK
jgi:hypothetical protein